VVAIGWSPPNVNRNFMQLTAGQRFNEPLPLGSEEDFRLGSDVEILFPTVLYVNQGASQAILLVTILLMGGSTQRRIIMSENVTLFPNMLQPAAALKAYAPIGVKFWESQETALKGLKEFADGWFARRLEGMQAALQAAKHIGAAETPSDILREYQGWLKRETELLAEDRKAYQQHVLRTGTRLSARAEAPQAGELRTA
jgi:hypothetical protein